MKIVECVVISDSSIRSLCRAIVIGIAYLKEQLGIIQYTTVQYSTVQYNII